MVLFRGDFKNLPSDAVVLTEKEALIYQRRIISHWDKASEVWALRHSHPILAVVSAATGIMTNRYYRDKFRLGSHGRLLTYLPIVVIPAVFTVGFHQAFVQNTVFIKPLDGCPLCMQMRAAAFQVGFGVIHPTVLAPLTSCFLATRYYTYRMPLITEEPLEVLKLLQKFTKPILPRLGLIMIGQAATAIYLTYKQQLQALHLMYSMEKMEKHMEQNLIHP